MVLLVASPDGDASAQHAQGVNLRLPRELASPLTDLSGPSTWVALWMYVSGGRYGCAPSASHRNMFYLKRELL
jgi:hypothetical protein